MAAGSRRRARPGPNLAAARRLARRLRADELDDDFVRAILQTVLSSAAELDLYLAPESDVPVYARTGALRAHAALLGQLEQSANVANAGDDAFEEFVKMLSTPTKYGEEPKGIGFDDVYGPPNRLGS